MAENEQELFRQQIRRMRRQSRALLIELEGIQAGKARLAEREGRVRAKLRDMQAQIENLAAS